MTKEFWDKSFSEEGFAYGETENIFIHAMSEIIPKQSRIGCFAEGEGRNAVFLAKQGHKVTAYDLSEKGLEKAEKLASQHGVEIETIAMDLTKQKAEPNQYDAAIMVFGHVSKIDQLFLLENMIESVRPGGYIMFEVYSDEQTKYQSGGPGSLDMLYSPIDILRWIKPYRCIRFFYGEAERNEGKRHSGKGHVIQVVIQKPEDM